ncbi:hypothetical protein P7C70_g4121, partial [Phenoliferia sp. Uapishka_3]
MSFNAQPQTYQSRPNFASPPPAGLPQFAGAPPVPPSAVPQGTLAPGTIVKVGAYKVRVDRFLSEGGFAHVYLATSDSPIPAGSPTATTKHVLKRMAVPDKAGVEEVGKEVEVMRLLKNHPKIVNFIEASVSEMSGAGGTMKGYEIYILMEWCPGGGIIDMMNTRLQNRLTESEILKIFSDTVEAVAHMHYQSPPLIHRDLKVENILLSPPNTFKLCDFGSTTIPLARVPTAVNEIQALEADINRTTTLQYRAPELVDVWSRKGYDEKIDIWALGVFLYKLCYYTTPFEEHGPLAILNAQYKIPPYPAYSNAIKGLIGGMLQERASQRPNIYQVHEQVCRLRGTSVKIDNKYASQTSAHTSSQTSSKPLPPVSSSSAYSSVISSGTSPAPSGPSLADTISPMRRGRPTKGAVPEHSSTNGPTPPIDNRMVRTGGASVGGGSERDKPWEAMSGPGWPSDSANGSSSAPISAAPTAINGSQGFSDSFASLTTGSAAAFGESFKRHTPSPPAKSSAPPSPRPSASSSGLFSDLVPPKEASGGLSRSNTSGNLSFEAWKASKAAASPAPGQMKGTPALASDLPSYDRKPAFSPNYDLLKPSHQPSYGTSSLISTPLPTVPTSQPPQLTGGSDNEVAPPLPRRPPNKSSFPEVQAPTPTLPSKPELISRASQTSPHLMASWRPPTTNAQASSGLRQSSIPSPLSLSPTPTSYVSTSASKPATPAATSPSTSARKPVVDLLGDDEDDFAPSPVSRPPPAQPVTASASLPPSTATKRMSLGGELGADAARGKFRPTRPSDAFVQPPTIGVMGKSASGYTSSFSPTSAYSAGKTGTANDALDAKDRFPSLDDFDAPSLNKVHSPKEESWQAIVEKEEDSSDDEPEAFAPKRTVTGNGSQASLPPATKPKFVRPTPTPAPPPMISSPGQEARDFANLPTIRRPQSSEDEGDIDLGPALSSIRKFAPTGNNNATKPLPQIDDDFSPPPSPYGRLQASPVIQQPTPQTAKRQAAISSLVSRYETISSVAPSSTGGRPPPPAKPSSLRKDSISSSTSSSSLKNRPPVSSSTWISPKADLDGFQNRFPDSEGLDTHFAASVSPRPTPSVAPKPKPSLLPSAQPSASSPSTSQRQPFKPVPPPSSASSSPVSTRPLPARPTEEEPAEEKFAGVSNMRSRWEGIGRGGSTGPSSGPGKPAVRKEWAAV